MSTDKDAICETVRRYVLDEFLPGEDASALTDSTPLITGGILDSIKNIKLVTFIEDHYGIEFEPHEISADHLDTLSDIGNIVQAKLTAKS